MTSHTPSPASVLGQNHTRGTVNRYTAEGTRTPVRLVDDEKLPLDGLQDVRALQEHLKNKNKKRKHTRTRTHARTHTTRVTTLHREVLPSHTDDHHVNSPPPIRLSASTTTVPGICTWYIPYGGRSPAVQKKPTPTSTHTCVPNTPATRKHPPCEDTQTSSGDRKTRDRRQRAPTAHACAAQSETNIAEAVKVKISPKPLHTRQEKENSKRRQKAACACPNRGGDHGKTCREATAATDQTNSIYILLHGAPAADRSTHNGPRSG